MTSINKKTSVALSSVFGSAFLTAIKLFAGILTGSLGILSEALHSALDLGAALLTYFAVKIGDEPPDKEHPYGHAKVESVSALIATGLLFLTSAWIIYEAVHRLLTKGDSVKTAWYAFVIIIISIIVDISRSRALRKVAKETNSQALEADALHFSSDIWSSGAVLVGLAGVYFGIGIADALAALVVAVVVILTGYKLGKRTIDVLVDTAPVGLAETINETAKQVEGVIGVERTRVRPAGAQMFVDITVNVSRKMVLNKVHEISQAVENKIKEKLKNADISVHSNPVSLNNETISEQVQIIAAHHNLAVHNITVHEMNEKKYINFDLEIDAHLSIGEAHGLASHLEDTLLGELGDDVVINTHIDPVHNYILKGERALPADEAKITNMIAEISKTMSNKHEVHDIQIRRIDSKYFISFHVYVDAKLGLEEAHKQASKFKYWLKEKMPSVEQVVVHMEPNENT